MPVLFLETLLELQNLRRNWDEVTSGSMNFYSLFCLYVLHMVLQCLPCLPTFMISVAVVISPSTYMEWKDKFLPQVSYILDIDWLGTMGVGRRQGKTGKHL